MTSPTSFRSELQQVWSTLRRELLLVALLSGAVNLLLLTPTLYMLQVYDRVLVSYSELTLLAVSVVALSLFIAMAVAENLRSRLLVRTSVRMDRALSSRLFDTGLQAALTQPGSQGPRPLADLIHLRQFATGHGLPAFLDLPWMLIYIGALALLHPALGVMALVFAALQCAVALLGHQRTVEPAATTAASAEASSAFLRSKLQGADAIESMGMLGALWRRYLRLHQRQATDDHGLQAMTHKLTAFSKFLRYTQQSLALGLGALLVIDGHMSVGAMIAANVLMTRALAPIDTLVGSWRSFVMARGACARIDALLAAHPAPPAAGDAAVAPLRGEVVLRNLHATAPQGGRTLLQGIDLTLEPGSVTVVVGPSGSGKSTLARLVAGAWAPSAGERLLDGEPYAPWPRHHQGAQTGYLPQEVMLFDGSIAENIARFGEVDPERVIAAAQSTGLHDAILRLPRGYDTVIGEAGMALSGGQQQRVALACAVYGAPSLVVLDEPNANLDEAGEHALATLVRSLKSQGCTALIVTHRPAILATADRLVMMRDGRIERAGRPDQIVAEVRRAFPAAAASTPSSSTPPAGAVLQPT